MGGTIETSRGVTAQGMHSLDVMDELLPKTFDRRGVADRDLFPEYPYRDDSQLYWEAIEQWVSSYVRIYYETDLEVQWDTELQAWGREVASKDGGRLRGLPNNGGIQHVGI